MSDQPIVIEDNNLSNAWYQVLTLLVNSRNGEISPLILTLTSFEENISIRDAFEKNLKEKNESIKGKKRLPEVQTVAETIFPQSLYEYADYDRAKLYTLYKKILPKIKKLDASNRNGTYFSRLIAFGDGVNIKNQLE